MSMTCVTFFSPGSRKDEYTSDTKQPAHKHTAMMAKNHLPYAGSLERRKEERRKVIARDGGGGRHITVESGQERLKTMLYHFHICPRATHLSFCC